jgi:hypothetical protein
MLAMVLASLSACLLPPEGRQGPVAPYPPEVDFGALSPEAPLLRLRPSCPNINMEVRRIVDPDTRHLRVRWVVNNNLPGTRLLLEDRLPPLDPGTTQRDSWRLDVSEDLDVDDDGVPDPAVLSFFVTDAAAWATPGDAPAAPDTVRDLGRPDSSDAGAGSVVEVRWAFTFSPVGECR